MVKFLVVRFSSIGDIVLTTPVVRCLKNQVEESEVHYLTKARYEDILRSNPYIDKLHLLRNNWSDLMKILKNEQIDYIIDLHHNLRTQRLKFSLRKLSFSVNKLNLKKWLLVNLKYDILPAIHLVDRYLETVKPFSVKNDGKGLDFFISGDEMEQVSEDSFTMNSDYIALVVGGGHFTKQIPAEKIVWLINQIPIPVVLMGGADDTDKAEAILSGTETKRVINMVGKLPIIQSAQIISHARMVVTPDTGLMHIAAAFRKHIFSLWGNTVPGFGMYPYKPGINSEIFEVKNLPCRPCSKIGYVRCPKKHFKCMQNQDYKQIVEGIKKLITV
jgi:ADP-heptose:LPS heptosyltransferase